MLIYVPHLDWNILALDPLLDKIIEVNFSFFGTFSIIISQISSNVLIGRCAKTAHILYVSRTGSFSLYSPVRQYFVVDSTGTD